VLLVALLVWVPVALAVPAVLRIADRADTAVLEQVVKLRRGWLTDVMTAVDRIGSGWTVTVVALGMLAALVVFRRWRHLLTWVGSLSLLEIIGSTLYDAFSRPRPYGVTIIGRWSGPSMPSPPVAVLTAVLLGIVYTLVVPGRPRQWAKWAIAVVIGVFVLARLYLGVDHPSDAVVAVAFGVAFPLTAFRFLTPNDVFPVAYRRGKTAHLDVDGPRGEAIRRAVRDQLGLTVTEIKPVGLAGSGGSTPLRLRVAGDPDRYLFAKLYAMNHVRADRWYKYGRTILYGRLEDETPYQSVKRLVEYEDYTARLLDDVGIPTATSYGIVELTPGREYLLATEFFDGALELGEADVDDDVIDQGLQLVRRLWDAGLAHRDIKPANLMVHDGRLILIDVAFVQIRPSPWREAVDLANMMLVLAVRTDAERVYREALRYFTPDEIAEAFAAARGVASPTQLRMAMKHDGRDLVSQFQELAPRRRPIPLQRWGVRRVALALVVVVALLFAAVQLKDMLSPLHDIPVSRPPDCGTDEVMILMAQSVPSATLVPCVSALPAGWDVELVRVKRNRTTFALGSDRAGGSAVKVTFTPPGDCDPTDAEPVPSDEVGTRRLERPDALAPALRSTRFYLFPGGCVTYRYAFAEGSSPTLVFDADRALTFETRQPLVDEVRRQTDLRLCGAGVPCPGGRSSS